MGRKLRNFEEWFVRSLSSANAWSSQPWFADKTFLTLGEKLYKQIILSIILIKKWFIHRKTRIKNLETTLHFYKIR